VAGLGNWVLSAASPTLRYLVDMKGIWFALLLAGCTEVSYTPLSVALTADVDTATFETAADYWRRCGVGVVADPRSDITIDLANLDGEGGGVQRGGVILIDYANAHDAFVFAHELGHVLGLRHDTSGAAAVMATTRYQLGEPYESDLAQLASLGY